MIRKRFHVEPKFRDNVCVLAGDCLDLLPTLPSGIVQCCVTSPPYWGLRDYGVDGQIGLEETPEKYVAKLVQVFREVHRVLRDDGVLWLNLGDSYCATHQGKQGTTHGGNFNPTGEAYVKNVTGKPRKRGVPCGLKPKDLVGIPWMVAFALRADGWYLRMENIWHKPSAMPESVLDRPTRSHEHVFLLSKSKQYYYDADAVREGCTAGIGGASFGKVDRQSESLAGGAQARRNTRKDRERYLKQGRNMRSVWTINTKPYKEAHFATFPPALPERCIKAATRPGDIVLDPFGGSGTTAYVAKRLERRAILVELNPEYRKLIKSRTDRIVRGFFGSYDALEK